MAPLFGQHWMAAVLAMSLSANIARAAEVQTDANANAGNGHAASDHAAAPSDMHAHHDMSNDADVRRTEANYVVPNVTLVRDDGKSVSLTSELDDGRPVVLNFIYTSCTTICPLSSEIFEQFQDDLGSAHESMHLVSISIDPEQDTPARLREYAAQYHAGRDWNHYSGTMASITAVQKAFNVYRGDKMSHTPLTLMRAAPGKPWIRFDGFARADDLMAARNSWDLPAALVAR
jgi:protein SCO1/2